MSKEQRQAKEQIQVSLEGQDNLARGGGALLRLEPVQAIVLFLYEKILVITEIIKTTGLLNKGYRVCCVVQSAGPGPSQTSYTLEISVLLTKLHFGHSMFVLNTVDWRVLDLPPAVSVSRLAD